MTRARTVAVSVRKSPAEAALRQRILFEQTDGEAVCVSLCLSVCLLLDQPITGGGKLQLLPRTDLNQPGSPSEPSLWAHHAQDTGQRHRDSNRCVDPGDVLLPVAGQQTPVLVGGVVVGFADPRQEPRAEGCVRAAGGPPGRQDHPADSE